MAVWSFEGSDVHVPADNPREAGAALVGGQCIALASSQAVCRRRRPGCRIRGRWSGSGRRCWPAVSSPGSATPTWLPLPPLVTRCCRAVPSRLFALAEDTMPPPSGRYCRPVRRAGPVGVERDDRVVQGGCPIRDIHSTAEAAELAGLVVVGDGAVDGRQRSRIFVDAGADATRPSCPRWCCW